MSDLKEKIHRFITSENQDEIIDLIIENTTNELLAKLEIKNLPKDFEYIVQLVAIKRYNRLSNEGMRSISKDNVTICFEEDDFLEFKDVIENFKAKRNSKRPWRFI